MSCVQLLWITITLYIVYFEACNLCGCHGQLIICKIFILEISLANLVACNDWRAGYI